MYHRSTSIGLEYGKKGWVGVKGVLSGQDLKSLEGAMNFIVHQSKFSDTHTQVFDVHPKRHSSSNPNIVKIKRPHLVHSAFKHIIHHPAILDIVEACLFAHRRPVGIRFQGDKLNIKLPHSSEFVPFHQDLAFYPHTNSDLCTVSIPLAPLTLHSGSLMFIPGSHKQRIYSHHENNSFVGYISDSNFNVSEQKIDVPECNPGSILVHHGKLIHGSPINTSEFVRPLLLLQYAASDAWPLQQSEKGAWGVNKQRQIADEWDLYCSRIVRGKPTNEPYLNADGVTYLPIPWKNRNSLGSIYENQKEASAPDSKHVLCTNIVTMDSIDSTKHSAQDVASTSHFADVYQTRRSSWTRLSHLVSLGPFGLLKSSPAAGLRLVETLEDGCVSLCNDISIFRKLHDLLHKELIPNFGCDLNSWTALRKQHRADEIGEIVGQLNHQPKNLLDIGCHNGDITLNLGTRLNLVAEAIHGFDTIPKAMVNPLIQYTQGADNKRSIFHSQNIDEDSRHSGKFVLPYKDESFDLVISLMALHHIPDQFGLIREVHRVLKRRGVLIFREHNCSTLETAKVLDLLHGLHHCVWTHSTASEFNQRAQDFFESFQSFYQSQWEWNLSLVSEGFQNCDDINPECSNDDIFEPNNPKAVFFGKYIKL
jgi:phytanoyl-CoA hydroxylase